MTIRELMFQLNELIAEAEANDDDAMDNEIQLVDNSGNSYPMADLLTLPNDRNLYLVAHRYVPATEPTPELVAELNNWDWRN